MKPWTGLELEHDPGKGLVEHFERKVTTAGGRVVQEHAPAADVLDHHEMDKAQMRHEWKAELREILDFRRLRTSFQSKLPCCAEYVAGAGTVPRNSGGRAQQLHRNVPAEIRQNHSEGRNGAFGCLNLVESRCAYGATTEYLPKMSQHRTDRNRRLGYRAADKGEWLRESPPNTLKARPPNSAHPRVQQTAN